MTSDGRRDLTARFGSGRTAPVLPLVVAAVLAAGCGIGARASPAASGAIPTPAAQASTATASGASDAIESTEASVATGVPGDSPPEAALEGLDRADAPGDLGSFTWDGLASESPWIVGATAGACHPGANLEIVLTSEPVTARWQARWAPVVGTGIGTPTDGGAGAIDGQPGRGPVVPAPSDPGSWSLALTVDWGPGRNAVWYWRVEVRP